MGAPPRRPGEALAARIDGLDLARFLALAGMFATHLWMLDPGGESPTGAIDGKAAALFAVLAGVGIVLTTRKHLERGDVRAARLALLGRGAALVLIGFALGTLSVLVLVILAYYGVTFWLVIPFVRWRARNLLLLAGGWALVWPVLSHLIRDLLNTDAIAPSSPGISWLLDPVGIVVDLLISGTYPAITWTIYVLVGMAIGKLLVERLGIAGGVAGSAATRSTAAGSAATAVSGVRMRGLGVLGLALLTSGAFVALVAYLLAWGAQALLLRPENAHLLPGSQGPAWWAERLRDGAYGGNSTESMWFLLSTGPHTGTFFDLAITAGTATAVIGACLAIGTLLGRVGRTILLPVLGAGAAPLTVYTLHVLAASFTWIFFMPRDHASYFNAWWLSSPWILLVHLVGALVIGAALRLAGKRGPLEQFVTWAGNAGARLADRKKPSTTT